MKIAIQGFTGSFHAMAAEQYFGPGHEMIMCDSFPTLFKKLGSGAADRAVMAIENTIAGTIVFNYALLRNSGAKIIGETFLRIEHALLAYPGQTLADIEEVRSHPMALMQCMQFFSKHPHIKLVEDIDTAYMAELIARNKTLKVAAIANHTVAKRFGLEVLKNNIEDAPENYTRFLILSPIAPDTPIPTATKATLALALPHQVGVLGKAINAMVQHDINITALQSTPYVGNAWEYFFYFDIEFKTLYQYQHLIDTLKPLTSQLLELGVYEKGI